MTIRQFLQRFMVGCSTVDTVNIKNGLHVWKVLTKSDVQKEEYYGFGAEKVISFEIHDTVMVLNIQIKK